MIKLPASNHDNSRRHACRGKHSSLNTLPPLVHPWCSFPQCISRLIRGIRSKRSPVQAWACSIESRICAAGNVRQCTERTCKLVLGGDLNGELVIPVLQAVALHVGAVVVPHLSQLELGGNLHTMREVPSAPSIMSECQQTRRSEGATRAADRLRMQHNKAEKLQWQS